MIPTHSSLRLKYIVVILLFSLTILPTSLSQVHAQSTFAGQATSQDNLIPATFTFQKNLSKDMTLYPDVVYLKKFLNQDPRTAILSNPCISPFADGYFDQATKDAVNKFQNVYKSEVLTPAGLQFASGVVGQYTRTKMNALLRTPLYAPIVATSTLSSSSTASQGSSQTTQQAIDQYFQQVNQFVSNPNTPSATTTSTTTIQQLGSTTNPIVSSYLTSVQQRLNNTLSTSATTSTSSQNSYYPLASSTNSVVSAYFQNINNTLNNRPVATTTTSTTTPQTPNANVTNTTNNPVVAAYLNSINIALGTIRPATTTATSSASSASSAASTTTTQSTASATNQAASSTSTTTSIPRILSVSPTVLSNCQQTITIIGQNFSPTQNMLVGSLGTFVTTANVIATTSTSSIQAITLTLKDFTEYMYNQSINAGYTREVRFTVMSNGKTSNELGIVLFTFPGERRSVAAIAQTKAFALAQGIGAINANGGTTNQAQGGASGNTRQNNQSGGSMSQSMLTTMEQTELRILRESPQGKLITAIGGEKALETFYGFTPSGHLNQKLQGNTLGAVSIMGGGSQGGGSSGAGGLFSGLGSGSSGSTGGSGGSTGGAISNFGGTLSINYTCTCSSNSLLTIQDVRGQTLQLIFQPGASTLHAYGSLRSGANVLGDYMSGTSQCLIYSGNSCTSYGSPNGTIRQIGTSK